MLIMLEPGLKCKACDERMKLGRDIHGSTNFILVEDRELPNSKFEIAITCEKCNTEHTGKGFYRDGIFRGIYEYGLK